MGIEKRSQMLVGIFKQHNNGIKTLVGKDFAATTHTRYETSLKHTVDFSQWKYKASDIDIRKTNQETITSYKFYLKSVRKCNQNTTAKYIKILGRLFGCALPMVGLPEILS